MARRWRAWRGRWPSSRPGVWRASAWACGFFDGADVEVVILPTPEAVCAAGADAVARLVRAKPDAVLGLPTGSTPRPVYAELVRRHRDERLSFARVTTFNLDEYVGVAP